MTQFDEHYQFIGYLVEKTSKYYDPALAIVYLLKTIEQDQSAFPTAYAYSILADLYDPSNGHTVANPEQAFKYLQLAANMNQPDACHNLGHYYRFGEYVAVDYNEALKWYQKAIDLGCVKSNFDLAAMYEYGQLGNLSLEDLDKAREYYQKIWDTKGNSTIAEDDINIALGNVLFKKAIKLAFELQVVLDNIFNDIERYYQNAIQNGNTQAKLNLAKLHLSKISSRCSFYKALTLAKEVYEAGEKHAVFEICLAYIALFSNASPKESVDYQEELNRYLEKAEADNNQWVSWLKNASQLIINKTDKLSAISYNTLSELNAAVSNNQLSPLQKADAIRNRKVSNFIEKTYQLTSFVQIFDKQTLEYKALIGHNDWLIALIQSLAIESKTLFVMQNVVAALSKLHRMAQGKLAEFINENLHEYFGYFMKVETLQNISTNNLNYLLNSLIVADLDDVQFIYTTGVELIDYIMAGRDELNATQKAYALHNMTLWLFAVNTNLSNQKFDAAFNSKDIEKLLDNLVVADAEINAVHALYSGLLYCLNQYPELKQNQNIKNCFEQCRQALQQWKNQETISYGQADLTRVCRKLFGKKEVAEEVIINGLAVDVYVKKHNLVLEYDGGAHIKQTNQQYTLKTRFHDHMIRLNPNLFDETSEKFTSPTIIRINAREWPYSKTDAEKLNYLKNILNQSRLNSQYEQASKFTMWNSANNNNAEEQSSQQLVIRGLK
ncbi:MAG: hypothetical protein Tsb005_07120 [Gammaproteobacteria bacterium]